MYGERLKKARKERKLSQEEVGELLNISISNISKYENEELEPNIQTLKELCKIYNVSADYIIGIEEQYQVNEITYIKEKTKNKKEIKIRKGKR